MTDRGYAKGRARRAEILDTAMAVFAEVGYRGASLRDIAGRCGISHPGLLHHFATKEALLMAVLEHRDQAARADGSPDGSPGSTALWRLVEVVTGNATQPGIVELFATLSAEATAADHPAHGFFAARYERVVDQLASAYRGAQESGALREGIEPEAAARHLVALMDGLQVQWLYDPEGVDMAAVVADHLGRQLLEPNVG